MDYIRNCYNDRLYLYETENPFPEKYEGVSNIEVKQERFELLEEYFNTIPVKRVREDTSYLRHLRFIIEYMTDRPTIKIDLLSSNIRVRHRWRSEPDTFTVRLTQLSPLKEELDRIKRVAVLEEDNFQEGNFQHDIIRFDEDTILIGKEAEKYRELLRRDNIKRQELKEGKAFKCSKCHRVIKIEFRDWSFKPPFCNACGRYTRTSQYIESQGGVLSMDEAKRKLLKEERDKTSEQKNKERCKEQDMIAEFLAKREGNETT